MELTRNQTYLINILKMLGKNLEEVKLVMLACETEGKVEMMLNFIMDTCEEKEEVTTQY